jgi:endonuclease/exonuclease/phosphatase family metal-dependent hydrolase
MSTAEYAIAAALLAAGTWGLRPNRQGRALHHPRIHRVGCPVPLPLGSVLRVLTLNLAHGRGNRLVQSLVRRRRAELQLEQVAVLLRRQDPHAVALQEADAKALWSGRFNHVDFLAQQAGYARYLQMSHVDGLGLAYGTALLARDELHEGRGRTFRPSPPTFAKGWVSAVLPWAAVPGGEVRLVSLHLDFSRARCRRAQLQELAADLADETRPLVVMGDFNSNPWRETAMDELMARLGLHTFEPHAQGPATHPATRRRIDWILLSRHLRFSGHRILPTTVSDHLPVLAEVVPAVPQ